MNDPDFVKPKPTPGGGGGGGSSGKGKGKGSKGSKGSKSGDKKKKSFSANESELMTSTAHSLFGTTAAATVITAYGVAQFVW
jgi:hypothetical protein